MTPLSVTSNKSSGPCAGNVQWCVVNWRKVTTSEFILSIIEQGYRIQFIATPKQNSPIISVCKSVEKCEAINSEIKCMLASGAISAVEPEFGHFVSRVFIVKKSNGKNRMIIDLSHLNDFVNKVSFRMEGVIIWKK